LIKQDGKINVIDWSAIRDDLIMYYSNRIK